jgi:hypothetical protein
MAPPCLDIGIAGSSPAMTGARAGAMIDGRTFHVKHRAEVL